MGKILSKLHSQIDSVEKKMTVLHKSMNDFKDNNDKSASKNLNALKKQIAAVKNDTDLIKSLYLKPDKKGEDKTSLSTTKENGQSHQIRETSPKETQVSAQETNYQEEFIVKVKEKLKNMTGDEIWILKQLLNREPLIWQNVSELQDEIAMPQFQIPKLSRKFIIDGLPVLMIKNAGDKMLVKWGEGLTTDKIEWVQTQIRGDW